MEGGRKGVQSEDRRGERGDEKGQWTVRGLFQSLHLLFYYVPHFSFTSLIVHDHRTNYA